LKVFFWNNLVGRFAALDAPPELQYAAAHRTFTGEIPHRTPVVPVPMDLAGDCRGAPCVAAAPSRAA